MRAGLILASVAFGCCVAIGSPAGGASADCGSTAGNSTYNATVYGGALNAGVSTGGAACPAPGPSPEPATAPQAYGSPEVVCETRSPAPAAEVAQVYAAVQTGSDPTPDDPSRIDDIVVNPAGPDLAYRASWFRMVGGQAQIRVMMACPPDFTWEMAWVPVTAGGDPAPTPDQFLPMLRDNVQRRLPRPIPRIAPADQNANHWTYVNIDTYFWVDQADGQWAPISATASVPGLSVTVVATPERLIVDPGDGGGAVTCEGAPPAVDVSNYVEGMPGCRYRYLNSSSTSAGGETFPVTVAIDWHIAWSASNGEGGDLGAYRTASDARPLAVAEIQAVIVSG